MAHTPPGETREKVYRFVRRRLLDGEPPTVREVQDAMGFRAVESARKQLEALVDDGRLVKAVSGRSRGYRLPGRAQAGSPVPLVGEIQAGDLHAAIEEPAGYVIAESSSRRSEDLFALRVRGTSMQDAGILDGDVVIVRRGAHAESGQIVVALVDGEATVKRLRIRGRGFSLEPSNPEFEAIRPADGACEIVGKVVGLRRQFE